MSSAPAPTWWLFRDNVTHGPFGHAYISLALDNGQLNPDCLACLVGTDEWKSLHDWGQWTNCQPASPTFEVRHTGLRRSATATERLPDVAQWICAYGLFVLPALWVLANLSCVMSEPVFVEQSPYFGLEVLVHLVDFPVSLAATITAFVGALKLRRRQKLGRALLLAGIGGHLAWNILLVFALFGMIAVAESNAEVTHLTPSEIGTADVLGCGVALASLSFQLFAVIWLATAGKRPALK